MSIMGSCNEEKVRGKCSTCSQGNAKEMCNEKERADV
jgi:hypothetical protein